MKDRQIYCSFPKNNNAKMIYIGSLDTHGQLDKPRCLVYRGISYGKNTIQIYVTMSTGMLTFES